MSGSRTVTPTPPQTHTGPISENITYFFTTSNACGGTTTRTATLHVVGSIDPPPPINLASLFYPTAFPTRRHPKVGLVASEKQTLTEMADHFKSYLEFDHRARLMIVGHADVRASRRYNKALSERRVDVIRDFLISKGVPGDKIMTRALGKEQQLSASQVQAMQAKDPEKPEKWERRHKHTTWLAYNRRADIILEPEGQQSVDTYPNDVAETRILWERHRPSLRAVILASKTPGGGRHVHSANNSGT